jgi:hypothetical protein
MRQQAVAGTEPAIRCAYMYIQHVHATGPQPAHVSCCQEGGDTADIDRNLARHIESCCTGS